MDVFGVLCWGAGGLIAVAVLFFLIFVWHWSHPRVYWKLLQVPSLATIPLLGDSLFLAARTPSELLNHFLEVQNANYRYTRGILLGIPCVMLHHPDDVEIILGNTTNIKKGYEYHTLKPWLREGLLLSDGMKWRQRRKLLTPTFHFQILEDNLRQISQHSEVFVQKLLSSGGKPFSAEGMIKKYTLDVICETAMGFSINAQENESHDYVQAIKSATEEVMDRLIRPWLEKEWIFNLSTFGRSFNKNISILHNFTQKVISERKEERRKGEENSKRKGKRKAFLDMILETDEQNPGAFTDQDVREEVDTFMFEGHDTTSTAINFALYSLAMNPKVQEQILEEQEQIFGDEDRDITMKDLQAMTYLEMVIKEVLRLYPPVPFLSRVLSKDTVIADGIELAAGTNVSFLPYLLHRHHEFWEDPEEFRPERFLPGMSRHLFCYIPFSAGPRNCIGTKFAMMELKTTLSLVVRRCHIEPVTIKPSISPLVILRTLEPIEIRVTPRVK